MPPKSQVLREETTEDSSDNVLSTNISTTGRKQLEKKESFNKSKLKTVSKINDSSNSRNSNNNDTNKNVLNSNSNKTQDNIISKVVTNTKPVSNIKKVNNAANMSKNLTKKPSIENITNKLKSPTKKSLIETNSTKAKNLEKEEMPVKLSDLLQPSTTTVVSTTTTTVTQPLKIEAKLELKQEKVSPVVDGRVLSATSVSQAMNKMNDTALQTQALMKESGLTKLSPAANAIIAMSKESTNPALDTKNATTALPSVEKILEKTANNASDSITNHLTSTGIIPSAKMLEEHVQNNMSKLVSPQPIIGNSVQKSVNDRIIEARTVVARDVKPIRITVKEKPMDVEVQSGNIRFDTSNGITERPR